MKTVFMFIFAISAIMLAFTAFIFVPKLINMKKDTAISGASFDPKESVLILLITVMQIIFMIVGLLGVYIL